VTAAADKEHHHSKEELHLHPLEDQLERPVLLVVRLRLHLEAAASHRMDKDCL